MTRKNLEGMTKAELKEKEKQLAQECEQLQKVIEASNTTVFDLLINEVKKEMEDNIAEEEWKKLKENQKKIESYRSIEKHYRTKKTFLKEKKKNLKMYARQLNFINLHFLNNKRKKQTVK